MPLSSGVSYGTMNSSDPSGAFNLSGISGGGTHQLTPYSGINPSAASPYSLPLQQLRNSPKKPTVNPFGQGSDIQSRINSLTNNYYAQMQAQQNAKNQFIGNNFTQGLSNLSSLKTTPDIARNIFQGAYNFGLVDSRPHTDTGFQTIPWNTQDNPNSIESRTADYNRNLFGASNKAYLASVGINPNAVSQAYQNFLNQNTSGRY